MTTTKKLIYSRIGYLAHVHGPCDRCPDGGARCGSDSWGGSATSLAGVRAEARREIGLRAEDGSICVGVLVVIDADRLWVHAYYPEAAASAGE